MMPSRPVHMPVRNLFGSSRAHVKYFTCEMKFVAGKRMIEIHAHMGGSHFKYFSLQLVAVLVRHRKRITHFYFVEVKRSVRAFERINGNVHHVFIVLYPVAF